MSSRSILVPLKLIIERIKIIFIRFRRYDNNGSVISIIKRAVEGIGVISFVFRCFRRYDNKGKRTCIRGISIGSGRTISKRSCRNKKPRTP